MNKNKPAELDTQTRKKKKLSLKTRKLLIKGCKEGTKEDLAITKEFEAIDSEQNKHLD